MISRLAKSCSVSFFGCSPGTSVVVVLASMISSNMGWKTSVPSFKGTVGLRKAFESLFVHVRKRDRK